MKGGNRSFKKSTFISILLLVFASTAISSAVGQSPQEETQIVYYHGEEHGGLAVEVEAPLQVYPGETINLTVEVRAAVVMIPVLYVQLNISGLLSERNETLLRNIAIRDFERVDLAFNETYQYPFEIEMPGEVSPGLIYGSILCEWTCFGLPAKVASTGFGVTIVGNKEYEELRSDYQELNQNYQSLQENYTKSESQFSGELANTRNMMYVLVVTSVVSAASAVFFVARTPRKWS